ncbi:hypothetical protein GQ607_005311 [Colletotrichum asianum]|uniref:Uncharacterized protein n=1 Tax=Colletotrichum asianum TaxID=702518 RepID=A0A8H3WJK1_9PEZI|nr:hypothetical protein GQ607_005311 [Colletotrichum asianum]
MPPPRRKKPSPEGPTLPRTSRAPSGQHPRPSRAFPKSRLQPLPPPPIPQKDGIHISGSVNLKINETLSVAMLTTPVIPLPLSTLLGVTLAAATDAVPKADSKSGK